MKKSTSSPVIIIIATILLLSLISANTIDYTIVGEKVLTDISLDGQTNALQIPSEITALDINDKYIINEINSHNILSTSATKIKYISEYQIEKTSAGYFFLTISPIEADTTLILPEGAILNKEFTFPKEYTLITNGKNIILEWENLDKEILISYNFNEQSYFLFYFAIALALLLAVAVYVFEKRKLKKTFTKNLYKDEKRIIEYLDLQKNKSCWTKQIAKDLDISKVKLSRKLRKLVEKGLIAKEPFGNENKISLK